MATWAIEPREDDEVVIATDSIDLAVKVEARRAAYCVTELRMSLRLAGTIRDLIEREMERQGVKVEDG